MKVQWQVTDDPAGSKHNELVDPRPPNRYIRFPYLEEANSLHSGYRYNVEHKPNTLKNIQDRQLPVAKSKKLMKRKVYDMAANILCSRIVRAFP